MMQEDGDKVEITSFSWIQIFKISVPVFSKVTPCQALTSRHYSLKNYKQKAEKNQLSAGSLSHGGGTVPKGMQANHSERANEGRWGP